MATPRTVRSDELATAPRVPLAPGFSRLGLGHILVVDDDRDLREAVGGALEDAGYTVTLSPNGADALVQLGQSSLPDLIVLDLQMPELNGPGFLREALHHPTYGRIPIVIVSGTSLDNEEAAALGVTGYLKKPVAPGHLLEAVERARCDWDDDALSCTKWRSTPHG